MTSCDPFVPKIMNGRRQKRAIPTSAGWTDLIDRAVGTVNWWRVTFVCYQLCQTNRHITWSYRQNRTFGDWWRVVFVCYQLWQTNGHITWSCWQNSTFGDWWRVIFVCYQLWQTNRHIAWSYVLTTQISSFVNHPYRIIVNHPNRIIVNHPNRIIC